MRDEVVQIMAEVLSVDVQSLTDGLSIGDIPQWSSMAQMNLIATLEKRLAIEFPIEDLFDLTSVGAIVVEVEKVKNA